jgi:outer membrane receptor for ferrienterochelin and colicins
MTRIRIGLTFTVLLGLAAPIAAQQKPPDLTTMGIEDLMKMEIEPVFGASRRLQPVTEAPSSVTIITAEDITRFGYRTLAEILQGVRGFYVSDDRNYSYAGTRGFAQPGDYNTRVLLLIDGHRINDAVYDQAPIGHELGLDVTTFDRVEIIRGPSSSLYGTNAFFAVVNVITKGATDEASVIVEGGQLGTRAVRAQVARALSPTVRAFIGASYFESDGMTRLHFPEYADQNGGIAHNLDNEQAHSVFAKLMWRGATLTAATSSRTRAVPTAAYDVIFNDPAFETSDRRSFVDLNAYYGLGTSKLTVRAFADRYAYEGVYPYPEGNLDDSATAVWWGAEARMSTPVGTRNMVTAGAELRKSPQQDQFSRTPGLPADDLRIEQSSSFWALFVDDEVRLHDKVRVNVGLRYDRYDTFDRVTPRAALIVNRSSNEAFKYLFGTAFRAPNAYESDYLTGGDRSAKLQPETANSHELVWERYVGDWLRTSVSGYSNDVTNLLRLVSTDSDALIFRNLGEVHSRGLEVELEARHKSGWRGLASYGLQETVDQETKLELTNSPRHLLQARGWMPLPWAGAGLSMELRNISRRFTLDRGTVNAATTMNLGLSVPLGPRFVLEANARNLFAADVAEPGSEEHRQRAITQNGRVLRVGVAWRWRR